MTVKPYWMEVPHSASEYLERKWFIPHDIASNPNNQFYAGDVEAFLENFDLIAFLHSPDDKTQIVFRFWTVNEQLLNRSWPWDLFTGRGVGSLSLKRKPLVELIGLVQQHTQDLVDIPEPAPIFELIPPTRYADYFIVDSASKETFIYKHEPLSTGNHSDTSTLFYCATGTSTWGLPLGIYLTTIQLPRKTAHTRDFEQASDRSYGSLNLTKRGAEEFCGILRERLEFLKQNGRSE